MSLPNGLITGRTARMPGDYAPQAKAPVPSRHTPGRMNKREANYAIELEARKRNGEISWWGFEAVTLKLAEKPDGSKMKAVRYTPDFFVVLADGAMEFHETKGFAREDWIIKWKICIERYPMFRFVLVD
jgi:hypothetical protein